MSLFIRQHFFFTVAEFADEYNSGSSKRVKRIISGQDTDHSNTPYMVSMQAKIVTQRFFGIPIAHRRVYCGGTLIADRWVLPAAHCFK